ncbi:hypothetical protein ACEN9D_13020 [Pseudomonas sp. CT11-2]|uniref:hypothetical protein n=1 Tax=unclassified Pseudomonas TaxID=196821 RepID=UPI00215E67CC|nr:hypothetical protein [Pseudomonas sp. B21-019]UVM30836.1 hypothetical protein LOY36_16735 [Pseudomonas sp. B21-019]
MKTYCPLFWSEDLGVDYSAPVINLKDILPTVGKNTFAFFDNTDSLLPGDTILLIWFPPASNLNGWSDQPSEIALSHLLNANVVGAAQASEPPVEATHPHYGKRKYELDILSSERFLTVLQALQEDATSWHLSTIGSAQGPFLAWDEVSWCGSAVVEGFTYLTASTPHEVHMELIVEMANEEIIGLFSVHIDPGGTFYEFGRRRLTWSELRAIKQALNIARPLHDSQAAYLAT